MISFGTVPSNTVRLTLFKVTIKPQGDHMFIIYRTWFRSISVWAKKKKKNINKVKSKIQWPYVLYSQTVQKSDKVQLMIINKWTYNITADICTHIHLLSLLDFHFNTLDVFVFDCLRFNCKFCYQLNYSNMK